MNSLRLDDTIVAISTPIGEGGIGIVRLSGKDSLKIADKIFASKDNKKPSKFRTYTVHYGHIVEKVHKIVDEVILTVMRAPRSYTKEDVVEINCHSGIVPLKKILDLVLISGARLAEPGEFTKRAFLNNRIDIMQAEAVIDIIRAKTDLSLRAAMNSLQGLFSKKVHDIRGEMLDTLARIEASIDFSEEADVEKKGTITILARLCRIEKDMEKLISKAREGKVLRQGIRLVICGSPNVGKSSLMNAILKESRAIVTHMPGTTRDTIEETANIQGIPVVLVDTAGIRASGHPAEKEGVKRSLSSVQTADLVLLVLDHNRKLHRNDLEIIDSIKGKDDIIIVVNKKDLKRNIDLRYAKKVFSKSPVIYTCATDLSGIDKVEDAIKKLIFKGRVPAADMASVSNERQLSALRNSLADIKEAVGAIKNKVSMDCVAIYLRSSIGTVGEMTGHTITGEALDRIFSEFCIGK
ncbi:MAG: tRNA uridine-5-carboxymethylaminomethyl(34) synthesis GTPase MnmE [Candidatus Omnitrophica bacterium]|nr:tRNA uridine-5-carboxymethylaminomethyl(34) synthesis GTPase MnmE [Candidatus Omnitrophota bacterium]